ncbi:MAG: sugar phosphate isomerase/epimerase family protein [Armatimonadota bacterium]
MEVGLLTAPFRQESLEHVVKWAADVGFDCLEVASGPGSKHCDQTELKDEDVAAVKGLVEAHNIRISSLASYVNVTDPDAAARSETLDNLKKLVDVAESLGVEVVCTMAGMPVPGKDRLETIAEDCPQVFGELCPYAAEKGIKIALENWFATNLLNLECFRLLFEVCPHENFGLNFDPSHLLHQQIDYLHAVERFADRIFHTHAKDTEVNQQKLRWIGNQARGWWRYVIPGYGKIDWGEYIACLRHNGFNGVLSIEHEDSAFGREEGFVKGLRHLRQFA